MTKIITKTKHHQEENPPHQELVNKENTHLSETQRLEEVAQGIWNGCPFPLLFPKNLLLVTAKDRTLD